jgi:hypothetical protein
MRENRTFGSDGGEEQSFPTHINQLLAIKLSLKGLIFELMIILLMLLQLICLKYIDV